ncbi:hypothetical protein GCM10008014_44210 [Paenibacillus silvae]|uniref:Uncharacterized protein n=1 Tax=Paenibacillus silvae TaxID=1325358 RepID=A0ABQ1ZGP0_9BACL|nr:hypothetical protein GCM10008014_44210 [Paenibacillus silvae]
MLGLELTLRDERTGLPGLGGRWGEVLLGLNFSADANESRTPYLRRIGLLKIVTIPSNLISPK